MRRLVLMQRRPGEVGLGRAVEVGSVGRNVSTAAEAIVRVLSADLHSCWTAV